MSQSSPEIARERARNFHDRFQGSEFATAYQGIPIFAAPGLHELALACLSSVMPATASVDVLELGAGGGAMSLRLADHGYRVWASDLFEDSFTPRAKIPFQTLDLNRPFAEAVGRQFDAVVALELVEHLENPHHFLRQCRVLLRPGGTLLLSTPNLANPVSQAMFVRDGVFQWFGDDDYREQGHIMPLAPMVLRRCATEAGFACDWEGSVSDPMRTLAGRRHRRLRWLAKALAAVSRTPASLRGEVWMAMFKAPAD
ncbi:MAG: methyltransferase domain-containing protein [Pseudomonadota bacterium]|nr:methyltransferase domain-containing protein [Pseudomonadota bacterium]